tara:strand:- start:257 stop:394 length:138 start_codon:yes stop_codon:yes gene_type:complete
MAEEVEVEVFKLSSFLQLGYLMKNTLYILEKFQSKPNAQKHSFSF